MTGATIRATMEPRYVSSSELSARPSTPWTCSRLKTVAMMLLAANETAASAA